MTTENQTPNFGGLQVAAFESRHAKEMAALISRYGGIPCVAPSVREVPLEDYSAAFEFGKMLLDGQFDTVVFMTGVGTRTLVHALETRHSHEQIVKSLSKIRIVARGPKAVRALRELHVPIAITVPDPHTWQTLLSVLDGQPGGFKLRDSRIAIQEYGASNQDLLDELAKRGARPFRIPVYRWSLPDDLGPLQDALTAIVEGDVRVVLFTSAVQVDHVVQIAGERGLSESLKGSLASAAVCSVGPTCSEALRNHGIVVDVESERHNMGGLVYEAARLSSALLQNKVKEHELGTQNSGSGTPHSGVPD
jgi:uroporphyrinogen-III synthase